MRPVEAFILHYPAFKAFRVWSELLPVVMMQDHTGTSGGTQSLDATHGASEAARVD